MPIRTKTVALGLLFVAAAMLPSRAQEAPAAESPAAQTAAQAEVTVPSGTFVDEFGTSFDFSPCGDAGTDLCAVLTNLQGESATEENLAFVGKQVIQAAQTAPN